MKRYLLDTNTVSHLLKRHPAVARRVVAVPMAALCISAITEGELLFGLAKRPDATRVQAAVRELLLRLDVLPWDRAAAARYGPLRAALVGLGKPLAPMDLLIAAHALSADAVVVTNDQAFRQVPGLAMEDWTL
nr:type II toxin-antitoxin system VapC family toxin [uncultured Albidiferax sp.]